MADRRTDQLSADEVAALKAEVEKMSEEELRSALVTKRLRQEKQKQYQREYHKARYEREKLLKQKAKELGIWDEIERLADERMSKLPQENRNTIHLK